jgi:DUF1016 N-terminal domain
MSRYTHPLAVFAVAAVV